MIKTMLKSLLMLSLFFGTVDADEVKNIGKKEIGGTLLATLQSGGSFQPTRGTGFTPGTPILTQPLIFGLSMSVAIPITFDTPFLNVPAIVASYESDVLTLIGATSPYFGLSSSGFAVNQITGINISDITTGGFTIHVGLFINGTPTFPDVQTAITQFAQYGFALNFIARETVAL